MSIILNTIQSLINYPHELGAHCKKCGRFKWLDLQALGGRLGFDHSTMHRDLAPKLKCERCGSKDIGLTLSPVTHHRSPLERN